MRHAVRTTLLALASVLALLMTGAPPAAASGEGFWTGTAHINCFGCGISNGTAEICYYGVVNGQVGLCQAVHATFTVDEPSSTCPLQGTATGSTTGAVRGNFAWTRVGYVAAYTTTGDVNGPGLAGFLFVGNPCGGPATVTIWGGGGGT